MSELRSSAQDVPTLPLREGRIAQQFGEGSCDERKWPNPSPKNSALRLNFSTLPQGEGESEAGISLEGSVG
jgi:hypothetical protein